MDLNALLALGARIVQLALQSGEDVAVVVAIAKRMEKWAKAEEEPTQVDFDELQAMVQPYLDILNDTSRDDPAEGTV